MNAHDAPRAFEELAVRTGRDISRLTPRQGIELMVAFYREERADDCPAGEDGDMLLYQWGTFDQGDGEFFELDITRQFILEDGSDDENIWQLSLTFKFTPTDELRSLESGNQWCETPRPRAVEQFESRYIRGSAPFELLADELPVRVELNYSCTG
jgi:hypothetical protein